MITQCESIIGDYSVCKWIDENYGKVEIIAIAQGGPYSAYRVFYRKITQTITNEEQ